jgi:hypothetical protein
MIPMVKATLWFRPAKAGKWFSPKDFLAFGQHPEFL